MTQPSSQPDGTPEKLSRSTPGKWWWHCLSGCSKESRPTPGPWFSTLHLSRRSLAQTQYGVCGTPDAAIRFPVLGGWHPHGRQSPSRLAFSFYTPPGLPDLLDSDAPALTPVGGLVGGTISRRDGGLVPAAPGERSLARPDAHPRAAGGCPRSSLPSLVL